MTAESSAPVPRFPVASPDDPCWEPLQRAAIAAVRLVALEVQRLSHAPAADDRAVEAVDRACELLEAMNSRLEAIVHKELVTAELEARAYAEGRADERAARRCGPHRNPGNLRLAGDA